MPSTENKSMLPNSNGKLSGRVNHLMDNELALVLQLREITIEDTN